MTRKKNKVLLISVISIIIIALVIGAYFFIYNPLNQSIVSSPSYICQNGKTCTVTPILTCSSPQPNSRVTFRTNADTYDSYSATSDLWIAINCIPNGNTCSETANLNGYCPSSTIGGALGTLVMATPTSNKIYVYNGKLRVEYYRTGVGVSYRDYTPCSSADTTITPKEPYTSHHQEVITGSSCSQQIKVAGVPKETLSCSGASQCTKTGNTYNLQAGQSIEGLGTGTLQIDYQENNIPLTTCTDINGKVIKVNENLCQGSTIIEKCISGDDNPVLNVIVLTYPQQCVNNQIVSQYKTTCTDINGKVINAGASACANPLTLETCTPKTNADAVLNTVTVTPPQVCSDGKIVDGYNVSISSFDQVITTDKSISFSFYLSNTVQNTNVRITADIVNDNGNTIQSISHNTGTSFPNVGKTSFSFNPLQVGYYTLKVYFSHPDGDYERDFQIQVTDSLGVLLNAPNVIQFDTSDIIIYLDSSQSGSPVDLTDYVLDGTYNGKTITSADLVDSSTGRLTLHFKLKGDGNLRIRAKGINSEYTTDWTPYLVVSVKKSSILISNTDFKGDVCTGSLTDTFETKDNSGNYVETNNQVTIQFPLPDQSGKQSDTITASGSGGKYSFTYNFNQGGQYTIKIISSNQQLGSSQLNGGLGQVITILSGDACKGGGTQCDPNDFFCNLNWTLVIGIIVAILSVAGFLFFVLRKRKK